MSIGDIDITEREKLTRSIKDNMSAFALTPENVGRFNGFKQDYQIPLKPDAIPSW